MMKRVCLCLLASALVAACSPSGKDGITQAEAISLADRQLTSELPQLRSEFLKKRAEDAGESWHIIYCPPSGSTGSPFVLAVHKSSGRVAEVRVDPFATARRYCPDLLGGARQP